MKKLLTGIIAVLIGATSVLAAPAPPVFNKPVKVGEGDIGRHLNKRMLISGTTIYAGYAGADGAVRVVKSENGGTTWGSPQVLQAPTAGVSPNAASLRLAMSIDPLQKGKKIVHAAWHASDPARDIIYYAYLTDRTKKSDWSAPVRLDLGPIGEAAGTSLAVTSSGIIHILHGMKYITAASFDAPFSNPVTLAGLDVSSTHMVLDSSNNLYVTYVSGNRQLNMTKKGESSADWTAPVKVYESTLGDLSNNHDLVVLNPNDYYVGVYSGNAGKGGADLLVTNDGGTTWTKRSVYSEEIEGDNRFSVAVSSGKVISFASEIYDIQGKSVVKVWRSSDNGATWSKPVTVKGEKLPNIALDSAGKLNILVMDEVGSNAQNAKLLWIKEK